MLRTLIVVLGVLLAWHVYFAQGKGVHILLHPISIPRKEGNSRSPHQSVQFQVQNIAEGTYHFGYDIDIEDVKSYREERRDASGQVTGKYGYIDPGGVVRIVEYEADEKGFRSRVLAAEEYFLRPDTSRLQLIGHIPKPIPTSFQTNEDDYF